MGDVFQAQRLTLARKRRGFNKARLAEAVEVTPQTITRWETEERRPPAIKVDRLAEVLAFPRDFFYAEMGDIVPLDAASFRALTKMSATLRDAALAAGTICEFISEYFDNEFHLPDPDVPYVESGVRGPEGAAARVRAAWGLGDAPISDVLNVLELHGVRVFALATEVHEVDAFSFWKDNTTPIILVGAHKTPERIIFDLAHELGHLTMHRSDGAPRGPEEEREANEFASRFLMPRADLAAMAPRRPTLSDLVRTKARWKVSAAALAYAMHRDRMISDWHYRSLCIEMSRLGRDKEIGSLPREQSQVLTKVLSGLHSEGVTRDEIARRLHITRAELDSSLKGLVPTLVEGDGEEAVNHPRAQLRLVVG